MLANERATNAILLEVFNPRGEIPTKPVLTPNPRPNDLTGKKVGLFWNGKAGADFFMNAVSDLIKERYPETVVRLFEGPLHPSDEQIEEVASQSDAVIYGMGD